MLRAKLRHRVRGQSQRVFSVLKGTFGMSLITVLTFKSYYIRLIVMISDEGMRRLFIEKKGNRKK